MQAGGVLLTARDAARLLHGAVVAVADALARTVLERAGAPAPNGRAVNAIVGGDLEGPSPWYGVVYSGGRVKLLLQGCSPGGESCVFTVDSRWGLPPGQPAADAPAASLGAWDMLVALYRALSSVALEAAGLAGAPRGPVSEIGFALSPDGTTMTVRLVYSSGSTVTVRLSGSCGCARAEAVGLERGG